MSALAQKVAVPSTAPEALLRISTAGSVDDGKSTLIGRLFHDTRQLLEDQIAELSARAKKTAGSGPLDLAALTDGLKAEREQGITIDVAYRHFVTPRRRFILADTPGHEQYTRNMATGASTADCAIVLVDARHGVTTQTKRHAYIATLLGIKHLVIAVNKMDLVEWSEATFDTIRAELAEYARSLPEAEIAFIPISALAGDNVVTASDNLRWYHGSTLLDHLERIDPKARGDAADPLRFPVQTVIRPNQNFRGLAGQIARGTVRVGDQVTILPAGRTTIVTGIVTFDGELARAGVGEAVTLTLADEVDVSRGDVIVSAHAAPTSASTFTADLVWMSERPLDTARAYLVKHTTRTVRAWVTEVTERTDVVTLARAPAASLALNDIGRCRVSVAQPLFFDAYAESRELGAFILIDPDTNDTVAAGMIVAGAAAPAQPSIGIGPDWTIISDVRRLLATLRKWLWDDFAQPASAVREHALAQRVTALAERALGHEVPDAGARRERATLIARRFAQSLPEVRALLLSDVEAAMAGDPAALRAEEVILCYPSLTALTCQRLAHRLYREGLPLVPRIMTEIAHGATGIDIHPGATIGSHFFIDHGTGVVIGETAVVGRRVRLYQGVTLGAKSFPTDDAGRLVKGLPRHPVIEDDVVIYSGATVLGRITVGRGSVIGGNVWVTRDVPPQSKILQSHYRQESFNGHGEGI